MICWWVSFGDACQHLWQSCHSRTYLCSQSKGISDLPNRPTPSVQRCSLAWPLLAAFRLVSGFRRSRMQFRREVLGARHQIWWDCSVTVKSRPDELGVDSLKHLFSFASVVPRRLRADTKLIVLPHLHLMWQVLLCKPKNGRHRHVARIRAHPPWSGAVHACSKLDVSLHAGSLASSFSLALDGDEDVAIPDASTVSTLNQTWHALSTGKRSAEQR